MNSITYITLEEAIAKHDEIILASGGLLGLRDEGLLISALTMIQNDFYYSEYHEKLTHLIFSINKKHCFIDGNKRASISLEASFLLNNGWSSEFVASFIMAMEEVVVWLANDEINKNDLNLIKECLFLKFGSSKDYVDAMIQELLTDFRNMVKDLSYLIQIDNDIITSLKKLNRINQIQIYKDEIIESEEWIRKAQKEIKIWELILRFLQN